MFCPCCVTQAGFHAGATESGDGQVSWSAALRRRHHYARRSGFSSVRTRLPGRGSCVISRARIISMDPFIGDLPSGDIRISEGLIVDVAPHVEAGSMEEIDAEGMLVMPGLVATHSHFLDNAPGSCRNGMRQADALYRVLRAHFMNMVRNGFTTVHHCGIGLSHAVNRDAAILALADCGLRGAMSLPADEESWRELRKSWTDAETMQLLELHRLPDENHRCARGSLPRTLIDFTVRAAERLGLDDRVGSLTPGKRADLIVVQEPRQGDPAPVLADAFGDPAAIRDVCVDGRFLKRDGRLTFVDEAAAEREAAESLEALRDGSARRDRDIRKAWAGT